MYENDKSGPPLFVPDLEKPPGAVVGPDGMVACVRCEERVPLATADVVGEGYRCAACTRNVALTGASDIAAHLSPHDRTEMRASGLRLVVLGAALGAIGAILLPIWLRAGFAGLGGGGLLVAAGLARRRGAG